MLLLLYSWTRKKGLSHIEASSGSHGKRLLLEKIANTPATGKLKRVVTWKTLLWHFPEFFFLPKWFGSFAIMDHRSVQSQLRTKNFPGIWHMPNYSLVSWIPKTGKKQKILWKVFSGGPVNFFFHIKLHVKERLGSLNEVCEGVAGVKNHTKKCCWP